MYSESDGWKAENILRCLRRRPCEVPDGCVHSCESINGCAQKAEADEAGEKFCSLNGWLSYVHRLMQIGDACGHSVWSGVTCAGFRN